jgi:alcohol dehydrogenase (cytochrome c)
MQRFTLWLSLLLLAVPFAQNPGTTSVTARLDVAPSQLLVTPIEHNWSSYNGDYTGRRYSALREIDKSNVSELRAQWVFHVANSNHLEVTPVVVDGMMLVTSANDAFALDAQTGRTVWH